ncbi:MAG TPA: hypothetical protein VHV49_22330 [Pseudonocardiaceae bacterium]|jgi:hypothetical protein|nr:hypothetical protein [Pseudonocardiaceae bacterium]
MGLVSGLDEHVEALMTAIRLDSEQDLENWRAVLREACPGEVTIEEFGSTLRDRASAWPTESVEYFLQTLESFGDGVRPVTELLQTLERQPEVYWQLYHQLYPQPPDAGAATPADRFGWLRQEQVKRLSDGWGDQWQEYLGQQLDYRWGAGWEATYATEGSQGYLDALIDEWLPTRPEASAPQAQPSPAEAERLIDEAIQNAVQSIPGADQLTAEELAEVAAEVRAEMAGSK